MTIFGLTISTQAAVLLFLLSSCGSNGEDNSTGASAPAASLKVPVLGKTLNMDDALLRPSCNEFYFDYGVTKVGSDIKCGGISVKSEPSSDFSSSTWTVDFSDGGSAFVGSIKNDDTKITINGTEYYCYLVESGKYVYTPDGQLTKYFTMPALLTTRAISKVSDIKSGDVFFLATGQSICDDLY